MSLKASNYSGQELGTERIRVILSVTVLQITVPNRNTRKKNP